VDTTDSLIAEIVFPPELGYEMEQLVTQTITNQKENHRYDYVNNEQKKIDQLVFNIFGAIEDDIREVELWYCRRYAKLAEAQGILAEVKEKYSNHLARCERILESPPSYWRSNPVLQLIAQGESHTLEFKETLQYNIHTNQSDANILHSSLKTIAGFLNADGGTLLIGVSDAGEIKGLERDFAVLGRNADEDRFELKIRNSITGQNSRFVPAATGNVRISFETIDEKTICRVDVTPLQPEHILHFDNDIYVRDGNQTLKLEGPDLTDWIRRRTES
jgi:hypothetical protein